MRDLRDIALSTSFHDLRLEALSIGELDRLSVLVEESWSQVHWDADDALAIRFEWLMPMIDAELRKRTGQSDRGAATG